MRPTETVDRVADVLEALAAAGHGLGVTEVAASLGVHKATASRLLGTLAARGLAVRDPDTGRYRLGLALVHLGGSALHDIEVVRGGHPVIEELMERVGEATYLTVPDRGSVLYVDQCTPPRAVVASNWTGRRGPLHSSSSGKVFAAFDAIADGELDAALTPPLAVLAKRTIADPAQFRRLLARVRRQGYATSTDELEDGLTSVAAPILSTDGSALGALGVAGPSSRLTTRELPHLGARVVDAAAEVARRLGVVPGAPRVR